MRAAGVDDGQPLLSGAQRDEQRDEQGDRRAARRGTRSRSREGRRIMSAPLYNRDILALAVATADYLPLADAHHRVSKRAPLCGRAIILDLDTDDEGRGTRLGLPVEAAAPGQPAAPASVRRGKGGGAR